MVRQSVREQASGGCADVGVRASSQKIIGEVLCKCPYFDPNGSHFSRLMSKRINTPIRIPKAEDQDYHFMRLGAGADMY